MVLPVPFCCCCACCRHFALLFLNQTFFIKKKTLETENHYLFQMITWTLDSGKLILRATSSLIKISGYRVLLKSASNTSNCALVNVVLSLLCFLGGWLGPLGEMAPKYISIGRKRIEVNSKCYGSNYLLNYIKFFLLFTFDNKIDWM